MHELSLMEGIVNIVEKAAHENNFSRVKTIRIVLGELKIGRASCREIV